mmetsp:Transcript_7159/g.26821  ORF Transcript_7159/g.26821 Transcript_7159/m.26821 type:complete len:285 (-) Transcript_7159:173-1027(-)
MGDCFSSTSPKKFPALLEKARSTPRTAQNQQFFALYESYSYTYIAFQLKYVVLAEGDLEQQIVHLRDDMHVTTASQLDNVLMQVIVATLVEHRAALASPEVVTSISSPQGEIHNQIKQGFEQNYGVTIAELSITSFVPQVPPYGPQLAQYTLQECWINNGSMIRLMQRRSLWEVYADLMQGRNSYGLSTWGKPGDFLAIKISHSALEAFQQDFRVEVGIPIGNSIMKRIVKESPTRIIDSLVAQCRNGNIGFPTPDGQMMAIPENVPVANPFRQRQPVIPGTMI